MSAVPGGKAIVRVTERPYPRGGNTHPPGRVLLVPESAAVYACEESDPPYCERVEDPSEELLRRLGLIEVEEPEPEPTDKEEEAAEGYRFTPPAMNVLREHGVDLSDYDGPATGAEPGEVTRRDALAYLGLGEESEPPAEPEPVDITPEAAELARQENIDPREVEGAGEDGRVLKPDIQEAIEEREESGG